MDLPGTFLDLTANELQRLSKTFLQGVAVFVGFLLYLTFYGLLSEVEMHGCEAAVSVFATVSHPE